MCGRYALALIRQMLQDDDMPVYDAPADEGDGAPRQSYNFAPAYYGVVYRADVPDWGAGNTPGSGTPHTHDDDSSTTAPAATPTTASEQQQQEEQDSTCQPSSSSPAAAKTPHYKLQSMKWGLVPSWTAASFKRNNKKPDYTTLLKTINCRADSLAARGGMWASMKGRKRCIVLAQGFYEWLQQKGGGGVKVPHYVKRRDGRLMCFAGLWDCVRLDHHHGDGDDGDDEKDDGGDGGGEQRRLYTYTIITTDSSPRLRFLHDRMPVILEPGSDALWTWLDPARSEWSAELQALLRPFEGELDVYPVSREVGKVGNNSPSFVIPVASKENKSNIANFFAKGVGGMGNKAPRGMGAEKPVEKGQLKTEKDEEDEEEKKTVRDDASEELGTPKKGIKREADSWPVKGEPPAKKAASFPKAESPVKRKAPPPTRSKISATSNTATNRSPVKAKGKPDGSQKITKFFGSRT